MKGQVFVVAHKLMHGGRRVNCWKVTAFVLLHSGSQALPPSAETSLVFFLNMYKTCFGYGGQDKLLLETGTGLDVGS